MKKKFHFKFISFLIILSLIGLETIQIFWLKNFYDTIRKQTEEKLYNAMKMADYKDLFSRLDILKKQQLEQKTQEGKEDIFEYAIALNMADSTYLQSSQKPRIENEINIQINNTPEEKEESLFDNLPKYLSLIKDLEQLIIVQMHRSIDADIAMEYDQFAAFLEKELPEYGIHAAAKLEIYEQPDIPERIYHINSEKEIKESPRNMSIIYYSLPVENSYYRLTIQNPQGLILWQMAGILTSSFLLTILVVVAFVYMLRTIIRQKTDEELKTDFMNNVTHELKTPVAVAMAANDALLNYDSSVTEKQKKYLEIIGEQLSRLTGMVEQILSLSVENRTTFGLTKQKVTLCKLLCTVIEQQKLKTTKEMRVVLQVKENFTIEADKTHLSNMLTNMIENAIKYTPGDVVDIMVTAQEKEGEVILSVADKGMGVPEEYQKRIFEKFFRVPQGNIYGVQGYGLGLYYVWDIMKRHNGTVYVKSQPGKGSVFSLVFKK